MKNKMFGILAVFLLGIIALSGLASAAITIEEVELDDDVLSSTGTNEVRAVERGESFEVKVHMTSDEDVDNIEIRTEIFGDEHDDIIADDTEIFDMVAGRTYVKKLNLRLTERMEEQEYSLWVDVRGRTSADADITETYQLGVELAEHKVKIDDIIFSPERKVKAGRALLATVRIENDGDREEEGIKVQVSIPELGISASDYIDELESEGEDDDETTSEEIYMRIPDCAEAGIYTVRVDVTYDDGDEKTSEETTIEIVEGDVCQALPSMPGQPGPETVITVADQAQDISVAGGAVYPLTIANAGTVTKTYTITVDGVDAFAETRITPGNLVVVAPGETKSAFVYMSAKEGAAAGEYGFVISVAKGSEMLQQIPLTASVTEDASSASNLRRGLEIGLVVLVVLLVILGLIIGFNKLRSEEESEDEAKTYY